MMIIKNRFFYSLLILSTIILIDLISFGIAIPADNTQIIIGENLKPGMTLKDAIELLGPPESVKVSNTGTVLIPYDSLGLSVEVMSDGTVIEAIHLQSTFRQTPRKETGTYEAEKTEKFEDEEIEENEDEKTEEDDKYDVFDLYGFKVKTKNDQVIITEIRPASVAEYGGLKAGERIRKAFYEGSGVRNIYAVGGLKTILKRAVEKRKKIINILQNENHYYKVEVPKRK